MFAFVRLLCQLQKMQYQLSLKVSRNQLESESPLDHECQVTWVTWHSRDPPPWLTSCCLFYCKPPPFLQMDEQAVRDPDMN